MIYLAALLFALMQAARAASRLPQSKTVLLGLGVALACPYALLLALRALHFPAPFWLITTANNFFLPAAAALVGTALGRLFNHPNTLLAGAGFAAFFDVIIVTMGTVAVLLKTAPEVITAVSMGGTPTGHGPALPPPISTVTIGPADVLFLAVFLAAVRRLELSGRATFAAIFVALIAALAVAEMGVPVPALAPMGLAVVAANFRHARLTRDEKFALIYGSAFALLLSFLMVTGARHLLVH